jgi:predicted Ser/Thr protein kinase
MTSPRPGMLERLSAALADRYRVERELGQGGMSTVFLAEDLRHNRQVAIKVLREDLAASMGSARFLREIRIAAGLQHPNILPLLDSGDADGLLFYVMPFVKGQSLRERLEHEGELPVSEAVRLLTEVVDALALAHEQGVVHRDIKPDNVMISGRHALVTDFGVAKALAESRPAEEASGSGTPSGVTTLGVAVGTPAYMSPEQAAADPHVDQRADIYAVGAMAYELLCGRPPFSGSTPQRVLAAQVTEQPEPLSKRRDTVSPALEAVIMRCLEKRPADRWQSAGELLQHLEPLFTPSGGMTPTQLTTVGAARARGPGRALWAVAGVVVLALVAGGVALWRHAGGGARRRPLPGTACRSPARATPTRRSFRRTGNRWSTPPARARRRAPATGSSCSTTSPPEPARSWRTAWTGSMRRHGAATAPGCWSRPPRTRAAFPWAATSCRTSEGR